MDRVSDQRSVISQRWITSLTQGHVILCPVLAVFQETLHLAAEHTSALRQVMETTGISADTTVSQCVTTNTLVS